MRNSLLGIAVVILALAGLSALALAQAPRGGGQAAATSSAPFDPKDINGVWQPGRVTGAAMPMMTPAAATYFAAQKTESSKPPVDGPENTDMILRCEPSSVLRGYGNPHPMEMEVIPGKEVIQMFETYRNFRILYTDGRKPEDHPEGTWYGDSTATWDGNTLVVTTVNFNGRNWADAVGHPQSAKSTLVERFTRVNHDTLEDHMILTDPVNYSQPWDLGTKQFTYRPTWELEDYLCSPRDEGLLNKDVRYPADTGK